VMQCGNTGGALTVVTALFVGLNSLVGLWLAHRRKAADAERRWFYHQMRVKHGLDLDHPAERRRRRGNGKA
jgi:hypothetical protein